MRVFFFLFITLLVACAPSTTTSADLVQNTPISSAENKTAITQITHAKINGHEVALSTPTDWDILKHETGIILTESAHAFDGVGHMEGLFIHLFLPDVSKLPQPIAKDSFPLQLLQNVVRLPGLIGDVYVTQPQPFQWDSHDAAYYTLHDSAAGVFTLLVGTTLPDETLVVLNLSTADGHVQALHEHVAAALDSIEIDGNKLHGSTLMSSLPNPLPIPGGASDVPVSVSAND